LLHAVIASNYHFLYRGISILPTVPPMESTARSNNVFKIAHAASTTSNAILPSQQPTIQYDIPDLLQIDTYGEDGVRYFQRIESLLQNDSIRPSIGHLGTTISIDAASWGNYSASIWPLSSNGRMSRTSSPQVPITVTAPSISLHVSYAWFCKGGLFYPRKETDDQIQRSMIAVVNGADGRRSNTDHDDDACSCDDSLVDALQYPDGCEIMFTSNTYLAIPSMYDMELRDQLRQSFLI
jgi:hypothetical protein